MREYSTITVLPSWGEMPLMSPQIKIWLVLNIESKFLMCFSVEFRFKIGIDILMKNRRIIHLEHIHWYYCCISINVSSLYCALQGLIIFYIKWHSSYLFPKTEKSKLQKSSIILNSINKTCSIYGISHQSSPQIINKFVCDLERALHAVIWEYAKA